MDKSYALGLAGSVLWVSVFYLFIYIRVWRKWFAKKIAPQWIEKQAKKVKLPMTEVIARMEKVIQVFEKGRNVILGFIILSSIHFLLDFFLNVPHDMIVFGGLILAGECIPMWLSITLLITVIDDRRKRIIEIMEETRSGQQSSLSEAGERNRQ